MYYQCGGGVNPWWSVVKFKTNGKSPRLKTDAEWS